MFKVAEGLACGTPHMISATIEGLARLAYEFSDLVSTASNLLPSTFLHIPTRSQEIIKVVPSLLDLNIYLLSQTCELLNEF